MLSHIPSLGVLVILISDLVIDEVYGRRSQEDLGILPIEYFGAWGEGEVEREVFGSRGESKLLLCRISRLQSILESQPSANITWFKDDLPVSHKRALITPDGNLNITKLVRRMGRASPETDEGVYRCLLELSKGVRYMVAAPPIILHLAELDRNISISRSNGSTSLGAALRLSCAVPSHPPAHFSWQKDHGELPHNVRFTQPTSGVLQISNLEEADEGMYRCVANNTMLNRTRVSKDVFVSVDVDVSPVDYIPPFFLRPTSKLTVRTVERSYVTLECLASGNPLPTITWQRKGVFAEESEPWEILSPDTSEWITFSGEGNLHVEGTSIHDAGRYLCTASSHDPRRNKVSSVSQEINLAVIVAPQISLPPSNETILIAQTVRLNCSVIEPAPTAKPYSRPVFFPAPQITWYKDGYPLKLDTRIQVKEDNQLVFINSVTSDTGVYQCLLTNEAGYASAWSYLRVNSSHDQPQPPRHLQYILLSPTSIKLKWEGDGTIKAYSVHFSEVAPGSTEDQKVSETNFYQFDELKPNTNYSFHVRAYSTQASDPSETIYITTEQDVPIAVPEFTLKALSPHTLLVSWSPLPPEKARGVVEAYKIQWQQRRRNFYNINETEPDVFEKELKGLHPGKTYKVRVFARTKAGYNENKDWPWKSITMPEAGQEVGLPMPLAPVMQARVREQGDKMGIEITWEKAPKDKAPLEGYILRYRNGTEPWSDDICLPPSHTSYLIQGITKQSSWYKIKLIGYNAEGEGTPAIEVLHTNIPPYMNQMPTIEKVRLTPESQTIVHLSWEVAQVPQKPEAFYTIKQQQLVNSGPNPPPILYRSTTKSISIAGLTPFSKYEFRVRAHVTEAEFGHYSPPVQTSPLGHVPPVPKGLNDEHKDASTVELKWEEVYSPAGPLTKYQIIYAFNRTLPVSQWKRKEVEGTVPSATISGLVSNTEYWFRVRGCRDDSCGPYTDSYSVLIPAILPPKKDSSNLWLIVAAIVFLVIIILTVYILKFRNKNAEPLRISNANGTVGGSHSDGVSGSHSGSRNGVSDLNGREGDYIPMLSRIHTDLPTSPLDTKGGYNTNRVNGFTNPRCNGVVRGKDSHYGPTSNSRKEEDAEERQHLFSPSRNGDLVSKRFGGDSLSEDNPHANAPPSNGDTAPLGDSDGPSSHQSLLTHPDSSSSSPPLTMPPRTPTKEQ